MTSPLDIPGHSSYRQLNQATRKFQQASRDFKLASRSATGLVVATAIVIGYHGFDPLQIIVIVGALALHMVTKRRMLTLERKMWWHQARNGLVNAIAEQRSAAIAEGEQVIDLRDSVIDKIDKDRTKSV